MQPLPQRPAAMLAVAGAFADEADAAILAGAAATLQLLERDEFVPQLRSWVECEDAHDPRPRANQDTPSLAPVVTGFWHLLGERSKDGGDAATLAEARRLLQLCSVSRFGFEPARVLPCTSWPLPKPITEDLRLRAFRRQPGLLAWSQLDFDRTPEIEVRLPVADLPPSLPSLPPGDWLLELASAQTHWRAVRAIEVSDLDVVGLVDHGVLALGAWRAGVPAATA
ncbi:MAG TPA: hypothetical protein VK348_01150, partial [Planctomycetota bacterium]|nr:hypothetical protein [Planctomycetota bacterium]